MTVCLLNDHDENCVRIYDSKGSHKLSLLPCSVDEQGNVVCVDLCLPSGAVVYCDVPIDLVNTLVEHPYLLQPIHVITDLRDDYDATDEEWIKEFQLKAPGAKDFVLRFVPLEALVNRQLLAVHITFRLQTIFGELA